MVTEVRGATGVTAEVLGLGTPPVHLAVTVVLPMNTFPYSRAIVTFAEVIPDARSIV